MNKERLIAKLTELKAIADECLTLAASETNLPLPREHRASRHDQDDDLDFDKPVRPFMKKYSVNLAGSKKFVLLVAWLAKGQVKSQIALADIKKQWNQMTAILEVDFNRFFAADAKDRDWVEARAKGLYSLRPAWKDIFNKGE